MNGSLSAKYVYRTAATQEERFKDQDIFEELRFDVTMPEAQRYEFHFLGTSRQDIDGQQEPRFFSPLEDIGDTGNHRVKGYLYEAHLDMNRPLSVVSQVRFGRQAGTRDEPVFFDGIAMDLEAARNLKATLYGGAAVHLYELNNDWGDDTLGGAAIDYAPFTSTSLSMDCLFVEDQQDLFSTGTLSDTLLSFKLWQRFSSSVSAMSKYRFINSDPRDVTVRALATYFPADLEVSLNYFRQFRTQNELVQEFSLYYDIIGQSRPYETYDVKARKLFGDHVAIDIGYYDRALLEEGQQSVFNREFERYYSVLELIDVLRAGLSVALTGEYWVSGERRFGSTGADIGFAYKIKGKAASVNVGTYYSLYKYDYYSELGERTRVRTYYVNGRYPVYAAFSLNAGYEYEVGVEDYQTMKLGMRYDF